jgi:hypothetical protein
VDYRAVVVLIVKTAGLVLVLYTIAMLPVYIGSYYSSPEPSNALLVWSVAVPFIVPAAVGIFMVWLPATTARVVVGAPFAVGTELERLIQPLIFSGIGLYLVVDAVGTLAYYLALNGYSKEQFYTSSVFDDPSARADVASNILSLVMGIALLLGARGLSVLIHRLRHGTS